MCTLLKEEMLFFEMLLQYHSLHTSTVIGCKVKVTLEGVLCVFQVEFASWLLQTWHLEGWMSTT